MDGAIREGFLLLQGWMSDHVHALQHESCRVPAQDIDTGIVLRQPENMLQGHVQHTAQNSPVHTAVSHDGRGIFSGRNILIRTLLRWAACRIGTGSL